MEVAHDVFVLDRIRAPVHQRFLKFGALLARRYVLPYEGKLVILALVEVVQLPRDQRLLAVDKAGLHLPVAYSFV